MMGTFVQVCGNAGELNAAFEAVARVEELMSPHRTGSDILRVNTGALRAPVHVDAWTFEVLSNAREIWELSGALFDVTREGSFGKVELLAGSRVRFRGKVTIDLGGIAKGFAVDRAVEALRRSGVTRGSVNAGGDLRVFGSQFDEVALREPETGAPVGVFAIRDVAVATTARYRATTARAPEESVRRPAGAGRRRGIRSVTVRAGECWLADALTKVAWLEGDSAFPLVRALGGEVCALRSGGRVSVTAGWS